MSAPSLGRKAINSMKKRNYKSLSKISCLLFFICTINFSSAQTFKLQEEADKVYLSDSTDIVDSLYFKDFLIRQNNKIIIFTLTHARIPDNCGTELIRIKIIDYPKGKFRLIEQATIALDNIKCGSFFDEKKLYCFHIENWSLQNNKIVFTVTDSNGMKDQFIIDIANFTILSFKKYFCSYLEKYNQYKKCYSCDVSSDLE